jgi:ABC-type branched-subunit amino acid transport system ATPase component
MLLVNHNMSTIPGLATRCMLLESGRLAAMGESQAIIQRDQQSSHDAAMGRVALEGGAS